jgi:hypothetical protein
MLGLPKLLLDYPKQGAEGWLTGVFGVGFSCLVARLLGQLVLCL